MSSFPQIPASLLPRDGRFGAGPSKVRRSAAQALATSELLGTSHRQSPVRGAVAEIQEMLLELFSAPSGYEVILGNGGASLLWDAIAVSLSQGQAQAACCGEFSSKAAVALEAAPWVEAVERISAPAGELAVNEERSGAEAPDLYLYAHNETSTGVISPVRRYGDVSADALTLVDATSCAGAVTFDLSDVDLYYFSPQKCFGSEGGLWFALASPTAVERIERVAREHPDRYRPAILDLALALTNSRKAQTYNTPAIATLELMRSQLHWMLAEGGLEAMAARSARSSGAVYAWASEREYATPFVAEPSWRSPVVCTIDFDDSVDALLVREALTQAGVVDIAPYRSLGRNQLRIATFPHIDYADVEALLACIDYLVEAGVGRVQA